MEHMKNGIIYKIVRSIVHFFYFLNLVEGFKWLFSVFNKKKKRELKTIAIDVFIICKWIFLILIWYFRCNEPFILGFVIYLIWTNIFTYFYYHVWKDEREINRHRKRRRFVSLMLAVLFSNVAFAFLYDVGFSQFYEIAVGFGGQYSFLLFSFHNSLFADYQYITPINNFGYTISLIQLLITFIFGSIVLNNSIPD